MEEDGGRREEWFEGLKVSLGLIGESKWGFCPIDIFLE